MLGKAQSPLSKSICNNTLLIIFKAEIFNIIKNFLTVKDRQSRHKIRYFLHNSRRQESYAKVFSLIRATLAAQS
jgi:hypothetical protein